ncbi:MAG: 4-(cytidine 5'-diphospho)-2-C-methyl-D-erythritol kinase [Spirochaetaceae bacterium]|jgi:4-diphosphocytidyl-2-C-methyl-D-erythritol kinase|nr:4-(cytidine 5'-diphospho)-2-C-methyl-D-erythritol kinase [Spirochaetaceae bacterium]
MWSDVCVAAPAKINIGLQVGQRGDDGYHPIESIFQGIPLYDTLWVRLEGPDGSCAAECRGMDLPAENTVTRAYRAFCGRTGEKRGVKALLEKRIPSGAGLGGGSSDAAAMIRALDRLCGTGLGEADMAGIGAQVGSDVPFFLCCGEDGRGAAVVTGRGEAVRPIRPRSDLYFVLVYPDEMVSTVKAYALLDEFRFGNGGGRSNFTAGRGSETLYCGEIHCWPFVNDFTEPVTKAYPGIARAIADMEHTGSLFTAMSGSGSSVFGLFRTAHDAEQAALKLNDTWHRCWALSS